MLHRAAPPNPSLKRSVNGRPPGPVWRYAVHFRQPGPGALPLAPPLARTLGSANAPAPAVTRSGSNCGQVQRPSCRATTSDAAPGSRFARLERSVQCWRFAPLEESGSGGRFAPFEQSVSCWGRHSGPNAKPHLRARGLRHSSPYCPVRLLLPRRPSVQAWHGATSWRTTSAA